MIEGLETLPATGGDLILCHQAENRFMG